MLSRIMAQTKPIKWKNKNAQYVNFLSSQMQGDITLKSTSIQSTSSARDIEEPLT